jgi:acetyltransferase-like isoleucine patch superfamily enzyme
MLRKLYLSPLGILISLAMHFFAFFRKPFMVYGYFDKSGGGFRKKTRVSSSAALIDRKNISMGDDVWVGHYCLVDGIGGVTIGRGVHVASHSCIYSHSSQNAIRLMGDKYIETPAAERSGYIFGKVVIGEYTFIGTSSVILPGTTIGRGCIIGAGSIVKGNFEDYSVIVGNPARVVDDSRNIDRKLLTEGLNFKNYYDPELLK